LTTYENLLNAAQAARAAVVKVFFRSKPVETSEGDVIRMTYITNE